MVDRRSLRRLKARAEREAIVVRLQDGTSQTFSKHAPFYLWAADVEEGMEAEEGIESSQPTTSHGREALALREALANATPKSRAAYEERFGGMFRWEESSAW